MLSLSARRRVSREIERIARNDIRRVASAVGGAVDEFRGDLVKLGVVDKYTGEVDYAKLARVLRKWEKRGEFYRAVARRLGVSGGDEVLAGKIAVKRVVRSALAAERVAGAGTLSALSAAQVAKLNELGDHLARKFAGGSFTGFARRYATDEKFRGRVNTYIQSLLEKNPDFAALRGNSPDRVVGLTVAVKAATMSRTDVLRDALKPGLKAGFKTLASTTAVATTALSTAVLLQATGILMTANPYLAQTMYMSYYAMQGIAAAANSLLSQGYMAATMEQVRRANEQQLKR